jgi:hypothetical protein
MKKMKREERETGYDAVRKKSVASISWFRANSVSDSSVAA